MHSDLSAVEENELGGTDETRVTPLSGLDLDLALEAILFISDEPQSDIVLATAVERPVAEVREAILRLVESYEGGGVATARAFELREVGGGWRFYVRSEYDDLVRSFVTTLTSTRLSPAALETLSVIAYKQPISRSQVASIRAVNVDSVVRTLLARGVIEEVGSDAETGALLYATTDLFLTNIGLSSLDELPPIAPLLDDGRDGFERG